MAEVPQAWCKMESYLKVLMTGVVTMVGFPKRFQVCFTIFGFSFKFIAFTSLFSLLQSLLRDLPTLDLLLEMLTFSYFRSLISSKPFRESFFDPFFDREIPDLTDLLYSSISFFSYSSSGTSGCSFDTSASLLSLFDPLGLFIILLTIRAGSASLTSGSGGLLYTLLYFLFYYFYTLLSALLFFLLNSLSTLLFFLLQSFSILLFFLLYS